ncbi:hypothetical protein Nepgr_017333 [Nepenthes gracilis]|uniref:Uncharacterized protein n=1 Tax=Nepenthes gracilis TaxID=150966 RepID=A0AAD3XS26_NEPGR|nr:hypothetical protein Nepgr_017333 [Nepenthes gracilis]
MVNTRVQASEPAKDVTSSDQDHAIGERTAGAFTCSNPYSGLQDRRLEEEKAVHEDQDLRRHSREGKSIIKAYAAAEKANEAKRPERIEQSHSFPTEEKRKHFTKDCKMLQREIEELIRRGHLIRFVRNPGQSPGTSGGEGLETSHPQNRVMVGVVDMITTRQAKTPTDHK